jgi:hypothetical protein
MWWFRKQKKETKEWEGNYLYAASEDNLKELDKKLIYAMEESRLYLQSIAENHDSLTQKTSFLLGIIGGLIGIVFTGSILKYDYLPWIF